MIYLSLFLSFLKIGTFAFGGGLSTITLIAHEVQVNQWLTEKEFLDILTISQMIPGPLSTNVAAYIGIHETNILGGIICVIGVSLPSFFIVLIMTSIISKMKNRTLLKGLVYGLLPVTVALIFYSAYIIMKMSLTIRSDIAIESITLLIICFLLKWLTKFNIFTLMLFGAIIGLIMF